MNTVALAEVAVSASAQASGSQQLRATPPDVNLINSSFWSGNACLTLEPVHDKWWNLVPFLGRQQNGCAHRQAGTVGAVSRTKTISAERTMRIHPTTRPHGFGSLYGLRMQPSKRKNFALSP
ncbi:hypothetical protein VB151_06140 [Xanthomonas fragariae]|nr:hypothetical protein [Xanthomonas fragariae]ENZ96544.1 hypothetical protein O1K_04301 [Xanthomonas fragariae LMG 25863]MBL9197194.1 hypothetical protein [Xanthomonas fragariae]MBL9222142.1 hypothetical protein [Xanthomonas fragariae]MDM7556084.1 hypothetical protein [Xanthomonas fragariae]MDM7559177.1 hypothetical protein [Xanthomonas fragariae]